MQRPRRIFRSSPRSGPSYAGGLPHALAVGLLGAVGGATLVLFAGPSQLFGGAPPAPTEIRAEPSQIAVVDGETLRLRDTVIRLAGIAAPPRGSPCPGTAERIADCGGAAADALAGLVRDRSVACHLDGRDAYGRPLGRCRAGDIDLNRMQLDRGFTRIVVPAPPSADALTGGG